MKEKQTTTPKAGQNRQQRRSLARDKKFQKEVSRTVRLVFKDAIDPEALYKKGILGSIRRNTGEIHVIVNVEGRDEPYFSAVPLNSIYDGLKESARVYAEGFNSSLLQRIAEEDMTPEEFSAYNKKKQEEAQAKQAEQRLESLRNLRRQVDDPECRQRWLNEIDADIAKLENVSGNASIECPKDDRKVS